MQYIQPFMYKTFLIKFINIFLYVNLNVYEYDTISCLGGIWKTVANQVSDNDNLTGHCY